MSKAKKIGNGPGKLCRFLELDKSFYGEDVATSKRIWFENTGIQIPKKSIGVGPRINIDYAGRYWAAKPWRFWVKNNPYVSK